jgi:hypothetical protein
MTGRLRITGLSAMPPWATIGLLGILLLGVLAMHGLASHYATGVGHSEVGATANILETSSPVGISQPDPCDCHAEQVVVAAGGHNTVTGLLTICVAVLVGIAVLLIAALVVTRRFAFQWPRLHQQVKPVRLGGPDPPTLYQLSLLRC